MLYVTTRNKLDAFTSGHTLDQARGPDGGCWLPYHDPSFSREEIAGLKDMSFNAILAMLLNKLFDRRLSSWDVDFCIGRYPVRTCQLANRVVMGEPWHNPDWQLKTMVSRLTELLGGDQAARWPDMAVRIGVLFGIYGDLLRQELVKPGESVDVAVLSGSFLDPMSAWYARKWGLPIGNIICCCNENNGLWNLICHGQFRTDDVSIETPVPQADITLPEELERLVWECGGISEMEDYLGCVQTGRTYFPNEQTLAKMREGMYVSVVSSHRIRQTIPGVYASHGYLLSPESALVYAGLQDYRAKKGQLRQAVVMTTRSPACDAAFVADTMGIPPEKVKDLL